MAIEFRVIKPEKSPQYREIRLDSLRLMPKYFSSSYTQQFRLSKLHFESKIELNDKENVMFGAFIDGYLVGICGLQKKSHSTSEIVQMYVRPEYSRQGIGTKLLHTASKHAFLNLGRSNLELYVYASNIKAISLYKKLNFFSFNDSINEYNEIHMVLIFRESS